MFQFARFASGPYEFGVRILRHDPEGVPPFGNPRIEACVPLPEAYRSLPRPSSPPGAKASTTVPLVAYRALTMALSCSSRFHCLSRFFQKSICFRVPYVLTHKSLFQRPFEEREQLAFFYLSSAEKRQILFSKSLLIKARPICIGCRFMCGTLKTEQRKRPKSELFFE